MGLTVFLQSVFAPGATALVVALALAWKPDATGALGRRAGAAAVMLGVLAGSWASFGAPWPVVASDDWFVWGALGGGALALLLATDPADDSGRGRRLGILLGLLVAASTWSKLSGLVPDFWSSGYHKQALAATALAVAFAAWGAWSAAARLSAARVAPAFVAWAGLASLVLMESGSARGAQTSGLAASALGALMLCSWLRPAGPWLRGASAPFIGLLGMTALMHHGYGDEVAGWPLLLLALPGPLMLLWDRLAPARRAAWRDVLVLLLLTVAPLLLAWWVFASAAPAESSGYGGYGDYGG